MAKKKTVWGVAFYGPIARKWWLLKSEVCGPFTNRSRSKMACHLTWSTIGMVCTIIPGTVQPDGSISWPKEWPVP